ncbi:MAG: hypothetical protein DME85_13870, partial [Verrucomicrobia bacterium]
NRPRRCGDTDAEPQTELTEWEQNLIETRSAPVLLGATHRAFTFYLGNPLFSILSIRFILSKYHG